MKIRVDPEDYDACPSLNDWLDERYVSEQGPLVVLGFSVRPSYVLHQLSFDTYSVGVADYLAERADELDEAILTGFPSPVAYYFHRFKNGYENELQRLLFLRDTWESIVDVVHALVVGECRLLRIRPTAPIRFADLLTDSVEARLLTVERLLDQTAQQGGNWQRWIALIQQCCRTSAI